MWSSVVVGFCGGSGCGPVSQCPGERLSDPPHTVTPLDNIFVMMPILNFNRLGKSE